MQILKHEILQFVHMRELHRRQCPCLCGDTNLRSLFRFAHVLSFSFLINMLPVLFSPPLSDLHENPGSLRSWFSVRWILTSGKGKESGTSIASVFFLFPTDSSRLASFLPNLQFWVPGNTRTGQPTMCLCGSLLSIAHWFHIFLLCFTFSLTFTTRANTSKKMLTP